MKGQGYCLEHHAESMRRTRPKHFELSAEQRQKAICRSHTNVLVRRGKLLRQPCRVCGEPAQAHHLDYTDPRNVEWLCPPHRLASHA